MSEELDNIDKSDAENIIIGVFNRILNNEDLTKSFSKLNDFQEMYEFCTKIADGYTRAEFDRVLRDSMQRIKDTKTEQLEDVLLDKINAGVKVKNTVDSNIQRVFANQLANNLKSSSEQFLNESIN
ncbi:MAG: hypothetical protein NkDv07_0130 [Candidatus Improbicoccus devescovinae]|nr:MAG: hypothetical protein NkDv07_0130 [Candidatus Improbicoccus devescovinae]